MKKLTGHGPKWLKKNCITENLPAKCAEIYKPFLVFGPAAGGP